VICGRSRVEGEKRGAHNSIGAALCRFFEVGATAIALAALAELHRDGQLDVATLLRAFNGFQIDPARPNPANS
jgi:pyruvate dehydrogenase E1 component